MTTLTAIGELDVSIRYTDRPTVKVVLRRDDKILLLNEGLLPGGGVDPGETNLGAITRELKEELGATVKGVQEIGTVVQYRNLLAKRYLVNGYSATLDSIGNDTDPQDDGEAAFSIKWMTPEDAMRYVSESIKKTHLKRMDNDANQGKLYNLMTTREFLGRMGRCLD